MITDKFYGLVFRLRRSLGTAFRNIADRLDGGCKYCEYGLMHAADIAALQRSIHKSHLVQSVNAISKGEIACALIPQEKFLEMATSRAKENIAEAIAQSPYVKVEVEEREYEFVVHAAVRLVNPD